MFPVDPESRRQTPAIIAIVACAVILVVVLVLHSRTPNEHLQHFAGVLRLGPPAHDQAMSDLLVRASQFLKSGDSQSAEAVYRELIAKYPNDPRGFNDLGACLVFQKRYDEAGTNYHQALHLDPQSARALYGLGCVAYYQKRYADAKDYLEKALLLNEKESLYHRLLGLVDVQLGDRQSAVIHYERAIALDPSDSVVKEQLRELKE